MSRTTDHDTAGRAWLKLADAEAGQEVELDSGFTCHPAGRVKIEGSASRKGLWFECSNGKHFIDSQADDGIHCVGIYPISTRRYVLMTVNTPTSEHHVNLLFTKMSELEEIATKEYPDWSSLLITILPTKSK